MKIPEEWWHGNVEPSEYDVSPSRYTDCVREYQAMAERLLFQNSFRLGARMMSDIWG